MPTAASGVAAPASAPFPADGDAVPAPPALPADGPAAAPVDGSSLPSAVPSDLTAATTVTPLPAQSAAAPPAPATAHAAAAASHLPSAAAPQVAAAVMRIAVGHGAARLDLVLQPDSLGRVQIRIEHAADGTTTVRIEAEHPQTLAALHRDQPALQVALDRAGMPAARNLSFGLATSSAARDGGEGTREDPRRRNRRRQAVIARSFRLRDTIDITA